MEKFSDYLKVDFSIDKDYLCLNDETVLKVFIANKSNVQIENGLLKLFIDTDYFEILDDRYNVCIDDFGSIGTIGVGDDVYINIPIKLIQIPQKEKSKVSCMINFHITKDNLLYDKNYTSLEYEIKILEINLINDGDFTIESKKNSYLVDEDIHCLIKLKNNGNADINNIKLIDYIPKNCEISDSNIISSPPNHLIEKEDFIIITTLKGHSEICIEFKLNICKGKETKSLNLLPKIEYISQNLKLVQLNSNSLYIDIQKNNLFSNEHFNHKINKTTAIDNDIIEHTVFIKNPTNIYTSDLILNESLSSELEYIDNSLVINDIYRIGENISDPIKLGDLEPNEELLIKYKTRVKSSIKTLNIYSTINYNTNKRSIIQKSNICNLDLLSVIFDENSFIKKQNKENYSVGDIINYEIKIVNKGNMPASNVFLKDILSKNIRFVNGSVSVDNCEIYELDITKGIILDTLNPNKEVTIKYNAKAMNICTNEKSMANLCYTCKDNDKIIEIVSNNLETSVIGAKICENNFIKEVSSDSVKIGDIITNKITIENTGNIDCENLTVYDNVNSDLEFIEESLRLEGAKSQNKNIFDGIRINQLKIGEKVSIIYQVKIIGYPRPNPIDDRSRLVYSYIKDDQIKTNEIYSTRNKIYVNNANLYIYDNNAFSSKDNLSKYISCGDYIFYSLVFENKGNVGLEDITLKLKIPKGIIINKDSIKLNNQLYNKDIEQGIKLPNLNISQVVYLDFYAKHIESKLHELESCLYIDYSFKDLKYKKLYKKSKKIKEDIIVINPEIEVNKFISDEDIEVDKEFTKNINVKNTGNVVLEDIKLELNENDFLKQSSNTLFINGYYTESNEIINIPKIEVNETVNIAIRYKVENIPLHESVLDESTVTAKYRVFKDKEPAIITGKSNKLKLNIKSYNIRIRGKCSSSMLMLNEDYNYNFNIVNTGNIMCNNLKLLINMPEDSEYIKDSIAINGKKLYIKALKYEIDIGELNCNESINVSFDFRPIKIPYKKQLKFESQIQAKYDVDDNMVSKTFLSNIDLLDVENVELDVIKSVSHDYLQSGDILKVHTILQNMSSVEICDVFIKDNEENNLLFIEDSVCIDGVSLENINPINGFSLESIGIDESKLISYEYEYVPRACNNKVTHFSDVNYSYKLDKDIIQKTNSVKSNIVYIEGALSTFKQFSIDKEHVLKDFDPSICEIVNVFSDAKIDDFYEIDSIKNKSLDNYNATGKKVIIKGFIMDRVEYLIEGDTSALYMLTREQPFTVFVNLPYDCGDEDIYFRAKCDEVYYKSVGPRGVFVSSLISIEGAV